MVADGLTKGSVERDPIILLYSKNIWEGIGAQPVSVSLVQDGKKLPDAAGDFPIIVYLDWSTIKG